MPTWTKSQQQAIDCRDADILVSAAAGSGKTAVLTERVIKLLSDEENRCDISQLLIVTFTNLAAKEVKTRIRKALQKELKASPTPHLRRQLAGMNSAKISTVHSFCYSLIKENHAALSLPAGMRIADEIESDLLFRSILDDAINDAYEKLPPFDSESLDFEALCDCFLKSKTDDKLASVFIEIYENTMNSTRRLKLISDSADMHREVSTSGFENSRYFKPIADRISDAVSHFTEKYRLMCDAYSDDEIFNKKFRAVADSDTELLRDIKYKCDAHDYTALASLLKKPTYTSLSRVTWEHKEEMRTLHDNMKDEIKSLAKFFGYDSDELRRRAEDCAKLLDSLYIFLSETDKKFSEAKKERKILNYADLEHYACRLLYDEEKNCPTPTANSISSHLYQVMVDEYQDTNEVQDRIFSSIGAGKRFMVGDIKQSIYGFRGAVPQIFADYRAKFNNDKQRTIHFSENFRCDNAIIELTNDIFRSLFAVNGSVPYEKEDELVFGKNTDENYDEQKSQIVLIEKNGAKNSEAVWVAEKIAELLKYGKNENGARYSPGDFAIIMRSIKNSEIYENELRCRGIPVYNAADGNFFDSEEIELLISLLSVIDNPKNDIYLASAIKSPLFGFSLDELIELRADDKTSDLYTAVKNHAESGNKKCADLLERLSAYRYISRSMPVDKFITYLYRDMNIIETVCAVSEPSQTEIKKANLHLLYEYAKTFEYGSFKGLYNFVGYLHDVIEKGKTLPEAKPADSGRSGVNILTIHKSKGLEFPVCFICECAKKPIKPLTANPIFSKNLLFSLKCKDETGLKIHKLPMFSAICTDQYDAEFYDEARTLYVALTRARRQLFITAELKDCEAFAEKNLHGTPSDSFEIRHAPTLISMILRCLIADTCPLMIVNTVCETAEGSQSPTEAPTSEPSTTVSPEEIRSRLDFVYPHKKISEMPKKVSVSKLYPDFLDETEPVTEVLKTSHFTLPTLSDAENTSAERGTATHVFMQFCDTEKAKSDIDQECSRLISLGYIPQRYGELIYKKELERFFSGELCRMISASDEVYREYRFNIGLPAAMFSSDPDIGQDEILYVQGVIDCFFVNADGTVTVVDYKTDRLYTEQDTADFIVRHRDQLTYYAAAIEHITNRKVSSKLLYSFCLGRSFEI